MRARLRRGPAVCARAVRRRSATRCPASVIAVGVLLPFAAVDNALDAWLRATFGISTGLLLTGTIAGVLFAYLVRFLAVALEPIEAGLAQGHAAM